MQPILRRLARSIPVWLATALWLTIAGSLRGAERPRLVVLVCVDQLPYEYLDRFRDGWHGQGVLARVAAEGVTYSNCHHGHALTFTGPGHAVLLSGAYPVQSGIIGNAWFDRALGKPINCVYDPDARIVGGMPSGEGVSPRNLLAPTLGDVLKLATGGETKVFAIGFKDRASVLTAGHLADGAFWLDRASGNWITSDAYRPDLPGYLRQLNEGGASAAYAGKSWELLYDKDRYSSRRPDASPLEIPGYGIGRAFPHTLPTNIDETYYRHLVASPFGNDYALLAAREIIEHEELGRDAAPDLLTINLAANDYVGHHFGPYSLEVEDMFYRTDRQVGELVAWLEKTLEPSSWVLAMTSDHGVAPIPEYARQLGLAARRDPLGDLEALRGQFEAALRKKFGGDADGEAAPYVLKVESSQVYLQADHPRLAGGRFVAAQRLVRDMLLSRESVATAVTRESLLTGGHKDRLHRMLSRAFHPRRSGDVLFALAPYQLYTGRYSTSHGSPWAYDTHVPLLLWGAGIGRGTFERPVHPGSLAPTLARLLRVERPALCQHEVLVEALAQ